MTGHLEAEQALLGAALLNNTAIDAVRGIITADDFSEAVHKRMFETMCAARDAGGSIDPRLLVQAIGDCDLGGTSLRAYVAALAREATTISHAPAYARAIREAAQRRELSSMLETAVAQNSVGAPLKDIAAEAIEALDSILAASPSSPHPIVSFQKASALALERTETRRRTVQRPSASYGVASLDKMTGGPVPGELIIACARPGMGKSTFALHVGLATARLSRGVAFFSLEMTAEELAQRALAALSYDGRRDPITYTSIAAGKTLTDEQLDRLRTARDLVGDLPITFDEQGGLTLAQIAARARRTKASFERSGQPLSTIVVDHLGLVVPSRRYAGNRNQELGEISAGLKALAKELGVSIVALSQLSRAAEGRSDKRPSLSDLRDSGALEQDADIVLGLYRPAYYLERLAQRTAEETEELLETQSVLEVEVLKQRKGPTGRLRLFCALPCNVIGDLAA